MSDHPQLCLGKICSAVSVVAIAWLTAGALGGASSASAVEPAQQPQTRVCEGGSVFVIGDSITDPRAGGAGRYTAAAFTKLGITSHTYGRDGLSLRGAINERYRQGIGSVKARSATDWVVALGTNDRVRGDSFASNVRTLLKRAGKRHVWWVNTSRPRGWQEGPSGPINSVLRSEAKRNPRMHIIDYAAAIKARPTYLSGDRVHLTPSGSRWLARFYTSPWQPSGCNS